MSGIYVKDIGEDLYLNIRPEQFAAYIVGLPCPSGWLRFKVKKRKRPSRKGLNFESVLIQCSPAGSGQYSPAGSGQYSANVSKAANNQPENSDDVTT